jgi:LmbE family N-acetylglucosaminyl deacetylase
VRTGSTAQASGLGPTPSVAQLRAIRRLRVVGNVLCIAAHPDDENTRLLSWLVHHEQVRTAYLSLTRGEGGPNLLGPERAPLLGLIRTQELLAARRVDGAEQFFGACEDFGYSKSRDETLAIWNRDRTLGEIVAAIRRFCPDVILTRFSPDDLVTHAHHSTSAALAIEAFHAAGDPSRFPEQLDTLAPWQATRVVWNWFREGGAATPPNAGDFFPIEVGGYDPLLGESYPELAARSLTMHRTQGFGASGVHGRTTEHCRVLAGAPAARLFDGIDRTWARVRGSERLDVLLARAAAEYTIDRPHESVPVLIEALQAMDALGEHPWRSHKRQALCDAILACAAIHASAHTDRGQVTARSRGPVRVHVIARSPVPVSVTAVRVRAAGAGCVPLAGEQALVENVPLDVQADVAWTGGPGDADVDVEVDLGIGGHSLPVTRPVVHSWTDPIVGERWEPVVVVPPVTVNPRSPLVVFPNDQPRVIDLRLRAFGAHAGVVRVDAPAGAVIEPVEQRFTLAGDGAEQRLSFLVRQPSTGRLRFTVDGDDARELIRLDYPHIPPITMTRPAEIALVRFALARDGDRIGYIAGAGDEVPQSLRQVGYDVTTLTDDVIETGSLSAFDAIVTGVRAFNTSHHLAALMPRLLAYAEAGGTLVVQYNTNTQMNALTAAIGPYPFEIGEDRVCEENAEVTLRDPGHPIFTHPNRIGPDDFSGWVQERGLCFSSRWDRHFTSLLSLHDHGEPPRDGGLLVATYGTGRVVYTGLAFFRQLPAGVPGAYRLFANLIARREMTRTGE